MHVNRLKNGVASTHPIRGVELRAPASSRSSPSLFIRICCGMPAGSNSPARVQDTRAIQQYLGHKNITHTVRYTELSPDRFKGFWKD